MDSATQREGEQAHPSTTTYLTIFAVLFVITVVEVGVFYVEAFRPVLAPVLITLSATKFALVAGYFMHLKSDSRIFRALFAGPLVIAMAIAIALLFLFGVFHIG